MPTNAVRKVQIWDAPTRVFHWLLALSFAVAYATSEGERWRLVHVTFGYTFGGLLVFRLLWGAVGTRYARFANFVRGPAAVRAYLQSLWDKKPQHFVGHNPAGAAAIVLMLAAGLLQLASGWASYNELGGEWVSELHEMVGNAMLLLVVVHLGGVLSASYLHRENLVAAMVTGKKDGQPGDAIASVRPLMALVLLAAVLGFWVYQWFSR